MHSTFLRCLLILLCLSSFGVDAQVRTTVPVRALPPDLNEITRRAGMIFAGTVLQIEPVRAPSSDQVASVQITIKVEQAVRGARSGQTLSFRESVGLWTSCARYRVGQRLMLFLYAPSTLGLTSPVGGRAGEFAIDRDGRIVSVRHSRRRFACRLSPYTSTSTEPFLCGISRGWSAACERNEPMKRMIHFHVPPVEQTMKPPAACAKLRTELPPKSRWRDWRLLAYIAGAILFLIALEEIARAGGPQYVAGVGYFGAGLAGKPITWANGAITYYTDLGNLSPLLAGTDADAFVADAFSRWTSVPTAAVSAARGGQLAEDVSGANVILNADRTISMPIDIQPSATNKPVAIVYDADGAVTDALVGTGASTDCFTNATFGGIDAFTTDGHFAHALVILHGKCATTSTSLPDLKYRLVRVLGQVFGLGWSQLNVNAITGTPQADGRRLAGFPVMHAQDLPSCVPISKCYPLADQPKMDDRAALARLYPVTDDNLSAYPGTQVFAEGTGRIRGSVYFTDANGNPAQPMQGVNVIARWVDPGTHQASGRYAAASRVGLPFFGQRRECDHWVQ